MNINETEAITRQEQWDKYKWYKSPNLRNNPCNTEETGCENSENSKNQIM